MDTILKERVISVIDRAEIELRDCFRSLLRLKNLDDDSYQYILDFQPKLATCLYDLMTFYSELCHEEKQLIAKKDVFESEQFRGYMASNSENKKAIRETIQIGKSLGDSFAWFFYRDSLSELDKHFEHEDTGLFVSGIGGLGELKFISSCPSINGCFVLYHGITSMLRVGDISLFKPREGIVAIGELKTKQQGCDHIGVSAFITSKINIAPNLVDDAPLEVEPDNVLNKDQLRKQLNVQSKVFKREEAIGNKEMMSDYNYEPLNTLDSEEVCVNVSEDKTLAVIGINMAGKILSDFLFCENTDLSTGNYDIMKGMILEGSKHNSFSVTTLDCIVVNSRIPIFWWDVNAEIIEKILFRKLFVSTVFNPAKLIDYFTNKGYSAVFSKKGMIVSLEMQMEDRRKIFTDLRMVFDLIGYSLMKCDVVIDMVDTFLTEVDHMDCSFDTKVNLMIRHNGLGRKK